MAVYKARLGREEEVSTVKRTQLLYITSFMVANVRELHYYWDKGAVFRMKKLY